MNPSSMLLRSRPQPLQETLRNVHGSNIREHTPGDDFLVHEFFVERVETDFEVDFTEVEADFKRDPDAAVSVGFVAEDGTAVAAEDDDVAGECVEGVECRGGGRGDGVGVGEGVELGELGEVEGWEAVEDGFDACVAGGVDVEEFGVVAEGGGGGECAGEGDSGDGGGGGGATAERGVGGWGLCGGAEEGGCALGEVAVGAGGEEGFGAYPGVPDAAEGGEGDVR